jgi:hypothetical protein
LHFTSFVDCGLVKSGAPIVALAVRPMLRGIRGQRKATKEAGHAKANDADTERQTNPLQNVGHLHPGIF